MEMMNSITIKNIVKVFKGNEDLQALTDINLDVKKGSIFGLIGPDGAGKTTLFRILTTLLLPGSGTAEVQGLDIIKDYKSIRKIVGYMPGKFSLYQDLSVEENLNFFATIFNTTLKENYESIKEIYVQIEPFKNRRAGALSGGMKQKLALCCALIHKPQVLFLDEPTTGVDVVSRKEFWDMLKRIQEGGTTIFVSTPYMDEASLCDEIALIQKGRILSVDTPGGIVDKYPNQLWGIRVDQMYSLQLDLEQMSMITSCHSFGAFLHVQLEKGYAIKELEGYLQNKEYVNLEIKNIIPTIEDSFIQLMESE